MNIHLKCIDYLLSRHSHTSAYMFRWVLIIGVKTDFYRLEIRLHTPEIHKKRAPHNNNQPGRNSTRIKYTASWIFYIRITHESCTAPAIIATLREMQFIRNQFPFVIIAFNSNIISKRQLHNLSSYRRGFLCFPYNRCSVVCAMHRFFVSFGIYFMIANVGRQVLPITGSIFCERFFSLAAFTFRYFLSNLQRTVCDQTAISMQS